MLINSEANNIIEFVVLIGLGVIGYGLLQIQSVHHSVADKSDNEDGNEKEIVG